MAAKYIFVTGGVVSSIGKGITVASVGRILKNRGMSVTVIKLDPYLNVDPGTMSPYQHGEVFVTQDGFETDMDLGHYERFIDIELTGDSNLTAGQVYLTLINKERRGDFLGGTIQTVPHVTNEIKSQIVSLADSSDAEIVVVEVGGTVGDIEGLPFLEAIRQMRNDVGRENVFYMHLTLLPYISGSDELKTKPTQHSVNELRSIGIQPDALICRSDYEMTDSIIDKLSLFCDVSKEAVIPLHTVGNVYEIPIILEETGLGDIVCNTLSLNMPAKQLADWGVLIQRMNKCSDVIDIAVVGKYVEYPDSYISVKEALRHAGVANNREINIQWVHSEEVEAVGSESLLATVSGIVIPGGFGPRGVEGMIDTAKYARVHKVPYLGLCLGMQVMVIEWARNILNLDANSSELDPDTKHPVIHIMADQEDVTDKGGTMRLGSYFCEPVEGTITSRAYRDSVVEERHRHRYELNNSYRESLEESGLIISGLSPDGTLVEITEVRDHPFMLGTQFHPEFKSRPHLPHPLFNEFVSYAKDTIREGYQRPLQLT